MDQKDTRTWGMLCHLTALSALLGVPMGSILGPLIVWLIKKNESPFVDDQGKESLNFQISFLIYYFIAGLLIFLLIGILLLPALMILNLVLVIIASLKANEGISYRYPFTIRFLR
ncbi:MAG: DUF4870 domain-containing protein [Firmicutes bacterium]|nr:DUF4870 domain-containing protein [Bacillota bacterium]